MLNISQEHSKNPAPASPGNNISPGSNEICSVLFLKQNLQGQAQQQELDKVLPMMHMIMALWKLRIQGKLSGRPAI